MRYIGAAEFKAKCLALMDDVEAGGEPITVTKRGRAVATLRAAEPAASAGKRGVGMLLGCMKGAVTVADGWDETGPAWDEPWNAEKGVVFNDPEQEREDREYASRRRKGEAA